MHIVSCTAMCNMDLFHYSPTAIQQCYDILEEPQCTNFTYINTFRDKMLLFIMMLK